MRIEDLAIIFRPKQVGEDVVLDKVKRNTLQYIEE